MKKHIAMGFLFLSSCFFACISEAPKVEPPTPKPLPIVTDTVSYLDITNFDGKENKAVLAMLSNEHSQQADCLSSVDATNSQQPGQYNQFFRVRSNC